MANARRRRPAPKQDQIDSDPQTLVNVLVGQRNKAQDEVATWMAAAHTEHERRLAAEKEIAKLKKKLGIEDEPPDEESDG